MTPAKRAGVAPARFHLSSTAWDRTLAFACVGALVTINAEAPQLIAMIRDAGLFLTFSWLGGVSAVIWFALFALLQIGHDGPIEQPRTVDPYILAVIGLCAFLPIDLAAQAGLLLAGIYLFVTSNPASCSRRASLVLLALTGPLLWGKILLNLFVTPVLSIDAQLVGLIMQSPVEGNMLHFAGSTRQFIIAAPCSSVHNISLAILLWTVAIALFGLRPDRRLAWFGFVAILLMLALNLARLAAIGFYPQHFAMLHDGLGSVLFGWAALIGAGLVVGLGVSDAFRRGR